jgi:hypothetical protein
MSLTTLLSTTCTIVRRTDSGATDDDGNAIKTETPYQTVCSLQQVRRDEPPASGELSVTLWDLFLPTGTAIDTSDAVIVDGAVYEVVGQPWDATEGSAGVHHVEATVKKSMGAEESS